MLDGIPGGSRTPNIWNLNPAPLPIGLQGLACAPRRESVEVQGFQETRCADPSGLEPELTDSESAVLPTTPRVIRLPEQDSNLQSRINNPPVYRLTDRGRASEFHCDAEASSLNTGRKCKRNSAQVSCSAVGLSGNISPARMEGLEPPTRAALETAALPVELHPSNAQCARQGSNLHALVGHPGLSRARLPELPPRARMPVLCSCQCSNALPWCTAGPTGVQRILIRNMLSYNEFECRRPREGQMTFPAGQTPMLRFC